MAFRTTLHITIMQRWRRQVVSRDFALLWGGQTVSMLGSHCTATTLILLALVGLHATPAQAGMLTILGTLPYLVVSPLAGALVDRLPRRPVLIVADIGRALVLLTIPAAALLGVLRIAFLAGALFLGGVLAVFFEIAYLAYVPALLAGERLITGNSKLATSEALAEASGPALAGVLVQTVGGPIAVLLDALSFVVSAGSLALIRTREHSAVPLATPPLGRDSSGGWRMTLVNHPLLRTLLRSEALGAVAGGFFASLYAVYLVRVLHIPPALYGALVALGGIAALVGAATVTALVRRLGTRRAVILAWGMILMGQLFIPLASGAPWLVVSLLALAQLTDGGWAYYGVITTSLRQTHVPASHLGRVNACFRFTAMLAMLGGAVLTVALTAVIPVRALLFVGVAWSASNFVSLFIGLPKDRAME